MQIDMHYYGVYVTARAAGLNGKVSQIIAASSQYVDDNIETKLIQLGDGSTFEIKPTAHHAANLSNLKVSDQRSIWVPFHFLPGNVGSSFERRMICRQDSLPAQEMMERTKRKALQWSGGYGPYLVGIASHVYMDTFAHYGFSGISSKCNGIQDDSLQFTVENQKVSEHVKRQGVKFRKRYGKRTQKWGFLRKILSRFAETASGNLGHGSVLTMPDRPYMKWSFKYQDVSPNTVEFRNNQVSFMEAVSRIYGTYKSLAHDLNWWAVPNDYRCPEEELKARIFDLLGVEGTKEERINEWKKLMQSGFITGLEEHIPEYPIRTWERELRALDLPHSNPSTAVKTNIFKFTQAAESHRQYVLKSLMPKYGLMVL